MFKHVISVLISIAIIAAFGAVVMAEGNTDRISGSFSSCKEICSYDADYYADYVKLAAEGFHNNISLGATVKIWKNDAAGCDHDVSYFHLLSNKGYFTGYYIADGYMYFNRDFNS